MIVHPVHPVKNDFPQHGSKIPISHQSIINQSIFYGMYSIILFRMPLCNSIKIDTENNTKYHLNKISLIGTIIKLNLNL